MVNHKNVSLNILELLKVYPDAGDNYNRLCSFYWSLFDKAESVGQIMKATPVETINRNYRRLVSKGLIILPEHRKPKEDVKKDYYSEFNSFI